MQSKPLYNYCTYQILGGWRVAVAEAVPRLVGYLEYLVL